MGCPPGYLRQSGPASGLDAEIKTERGAGVFKERVMTSMERRFQGRDMEGGKVCGSGLR